MWITIAKQEITINSQQIVSIEPIINNKSYRILTVINMTDGNSVEIESPVDKITSEITKAEIDNKTSITLTETVKYYSGSV